MPLAPPYADIETHDTYVEVVVTTRTIIHPCPAAGEHAHATASRNVACLDVEGEAAGLACLVLQGDGLGLRITSCEARGGAQRVGERRGRGHRS